jgi:hypothetical protein
MVERRADRGGCWRYPGHSPEPGRRENSEPEAPPEVSGRMRWFISYKAQRLRMVVNFRTKAYTSQECPCLWQET